MYILFKNARILTMENNDIFHGCLLVKDNKIEYVGKDQVFPFHIDKTIDCNGNLLMPGFKNAHAHTAMVFARSYADNLPLQEWLFDNIIPMEEKLHRALICIIIRKVLQKQVLIWDLET